VSAVVPGPGPGMGPGSGAGSVGVTRRVLPGFGPALGFTVTYLSLLVLIPLAGVFLRSSSMTGAAFIEAVSNPRAFAAYRLTFGAAFVAAAINAVFGQLVAWVLVRYPFPGRKVVDAMVDLPFAMPTAVAGLALSAIYAGNGWVGQYLVPLGIPVVFTPLGVTLALTFIGLPFVVRTVQPVLQDLELEVEEAAASLGASRGQIFVRITLPGVLPALVTGFTLAFARALGEYGSVVFISGNLPFKTEIATLLIMTKLEQYDYAGATAIASVMLVASFVLLLAINGLQAWARRRGNAPLQAVR
jgi:sulfate/thiosulfate transport system permease protein